MKKRATFRHRTMFRNVHCKLGLVLLVGGLTDEEQNNVATSLTVRITIKLLTLRKKICVHFTPGLHSGITINV